MNQTASNPSGSGTKLVIVAASLAILCTILLNIYVSQVRRKVETNTFTIYALKTTVREGERIRMQDIKPLTVPDTTEFREAFNSLGAIDKTGLDVRVAEKDQFRKQVNGGSILLYSHFTTDAGTDLDRNITSGKRLIELPVSSRTVPGALRVGAHVDIEAAFQTPRGIEVLPVMENVKVIALGTRTAYETPDPNDTRPLRSFKSMTIEVTPEEATLMSMIERMAVGEFDLHLRNPGDIQRPKIPDGGINPYLIELIRDRRNTIPTDTRRR